MPPSTLSEGEITRALRELGYSDIIADDDGLVYYKHPEIPVGYLLFDFSKGPIPWPSVAQDLEDAGVNVDAFVVYLEF